MYTPVFTPTYNAPTFSNNPMISYPVTPTYNAPTFSSNPMVSYNPPQYESGNVTYTTQFQQQNPQQQFIVVDNNNTNAERVKVIRDGEREYFNDGSPIVRVYKYCTCCRNRFLRYCSLCNCCVWFYSLPCWVWSLLFLLYLGLLAGIITLITQLPQVKTYYTYKYYTRTVEDYRLVITNALCTSGPLCTTSLAPYRVVDGSLIAGSSNIYPSIILTIFSIMLSILFRY